MDFWSRPLLHRLFTLEMAGQRLELPLESTLAAPP